MIVLNNFERMISYNCYYPSDFSIFQFEPQPALSAKLPRLNTFQVAIKML